MEIERRWLVEGWPALTPSAVLQMDQGYFAVRPAIRIRREAVLGGETRYVLCFKGGAGLAREEVEVDVDEGRYLRLRAMLSGPMIEKEQRRYPLPSRPSPRPGAPWRRPRRGPAGARAPD